MVIHGLSWVENIVFSFAIYISEHVLVKFIFIVTVAVTMTVDVKVVCVNTPFVGIVNCIYIVFIAIL